MMQSFYDEITEIASDIAHDTQYLGTFTDDPRLQQRMSTSTANVMALIGVEPVPRPLNAACISLITWGFYLGREHAQRGYRAPIGATDTTVFGAEEFDPSNPDHYDVDEDML